MINNKSFADRICINNKECETINTVKKLRNNEISIQSLDEKEKEEVYLFLKNEVLNKRGKLTSLKNRVLCSKAKYICEKKKKI